MSVAIKENKTQTKVVKVKRLTPLEKEEIIKTWYELQDTFLACPVGIVLFLSSKYKQSRRTIKNVLKNETWIKNN